MRDTAPTGRCRADRYACTSTGALTAAGVLTAGVLTAAGVLAADGLAAAAGAARTDPPSSVPATITPRARRLILLFCKHDTMRSPSVLEIQALWKIRASWYSRGVTVR
jgi:hypothetical protein